MDNNQVLSTEFLSVRDLIKKIDEGQKVFLVGIAPELSTLSGWYRLSYAKLGGSQYYFVVSNDGTAFGGHGLYGAGLGSAWVALISAPKQNHPA